MDTETAKSEAEKAALQNERLTVLTKSAEWGMLRAYVEDQVKHRMNHIMLTEIADEVEKQKQNFMKGECAMGHNLLKFMEEKLLVAKEAVELFRQHLGEQGE